MKIKSLLLGSVAAAGLSTGAFAADLNVLTSLDVCDSLGITGLTISSDTNCLQISGGVSYEFAWGDFDADQRAGLVTMMGGFGAPWPHRVAAAGGVAPVNNDWYSRTDAWLRFVGTAESDFGPASANIKIDYDRDTVVINEVAVAAPAINGLINYPAANTFNTGIRIEEAFVTVGDSTMLMAGQKGSIFNSKQDVDLTWLKLYNSENVGEGFGAAGVETGFTGRQVDFFKQAVIQVVTDLGNGFTAGVGLENLDGGVSGFGATAGAAGQGNIVGVIDYAGDTVQGHASVIAGGVLDGVVELWGFHGAINAQVDMFNFVAALAADSSGEWNALASASATFDIFTLAVGVEGTSGPRGTPLAGDQWGAGVSGSAAVTDAVTINLGFRWFDQNVTLANTEVWQVAGSLVFAATETITLTGEVGYHGSTMVGAPGTGVFYGSAEVAWAPGGGYTTSLKAEANSASAYKITYNAAKSFN